MDASSENILRMRYRDEISDPNMTDDELRYILSGKGVKGMGGRPNAIEKIIRDRNIQESQIRSVIQQIIKEELNMKEIDNAGKMAEYEAKTKKISEEILKRKKKLKALTTLEEIEKGSTNKDMMKSLKKEIKTLENLKTKLDKKFTPKEEVIGEETPVPLKEGYGGMSLKDAKEEAKRISKEEGVVQHVERTEEGSNKYRVSDWYDSDLTVASYNKGYEQ
jgi:HD superfamily phosphohydrolase